MKQAKRRQEHRALKRVEWLRKSTARANAVMDGALAFVETSNKRIAKMERGIRTFQGRCYELADLLAKIPSGPLVLDEEMRAWESVHPVGREFGDDPEK